ncbi:carboxypeptidase-like regulatory domain-containing protein, partial [Fulvivirga sp.]
MIKRFLPLILLLSTTILKSQNTELLTSSRNSVVAQVFELTDDQALRFYNAKVDEVDDSILDQWVASVPIDSNIYESLPVGHYLKVHSVTNQLHTEVFSVTDFNIEIGNNQADLFIKIWKEGVNIENAELKLRGSTIKFNKDLGGYWKRKTNKKGILEVTFEGKRWYFSLDRFRNNSWFRRNTRQVLYRKPQVYVYLPIKFIINLPVHGYKSIRHGYTYGNIDKIKNFAVRTYERVACLFDDYYCNNYNDYEDRFEGYALTNQPKYRKGDTVRFKALNLSRRGKPKGNKAVNVYLVKNYNNYKLLGKVDPYTKGVYAFDFVLHDSLEVRNGSNYQIAIGKSRDKTFKQARFVVEDYELKSTELFLRGSSNTIYKDSTFTVFAEGKDENELTIPDGKLRLYLLNESVLKLHDSVVFVPDTLWVKELPLKAEGETKISIPDSIWPAADLNLKLQAELRNSENELRIKSLDLTYITNNEVVARLVADTLEFKYLVNGRSHPERAFISFENGESREVNLPLKLKLNHLNDKYEIKVNGQSYLVTSDQFRPTLSVSSFRNYDSLGFFVTNDAKVNFTYFIYRNNRLIEKGMDKELNFVEKNPGKLNYYLHIQYQWGDDIIAEDYELKMPGKQLQIETSLPGKVYPGLKSDILISVKDEKGRPVEGADLTVSGLTKKFHRTSIELNNYTKTTKRFRQQINTFSLKRLEENSAETLDYSFWKDHLGLDSIEFYHFLYPKDKYYIKYIPLEDSSAVIAPFVVKDGNIMTSKVVYLDRVPVYFAWNTIASPYAFKSYSGAHKLKIRTDFQETTVDSVLMKRGYKTVISIPIVEDSEYVRDGLKAELDKREQANLHRYIFPYRRLTYESGAFAYLRQGNTYFNLANGSNYDGLTGPVSFGQTYVQILGGFGMPVYHESNFEYDIAPNLIKMRTYDHYPKWLYNYRPHQSLYDLPLTYEMIESEKNRYETSQRINSRVYDNPNRTKSGNSTLYIDLDTKEEAILNTLLFKLDDADFLRVYPGNVRVFKDLENGMYKLFLLNSEKLYVDIDSLQVGKSGDQFYKLGKLNFEESNQFSQSIDSILAELPTQTRVYESQKQSIKREYRVKYKYTGVGGYYTGKVTSTEDGSPLPGVNVVLKGTTFGTVTDLDGNYSLYGPQGATIVYSFIGLASEEVSTNGNNIIDVAMSADVQQLSEVVVTAYGIERTKKALGYSVSNVTTGLLQGRVAGVQILGVNSVPGNASMIRIRGASSLDAGSKPLVIVDGVIFDGDLNKNDIGSVEVLKGEAATVLYGSRASGGVVIIRTKGFIDTKPFATDLSKQDDELDELSSNGNSIRSNFKDYAIWEPQLKTNKKGEAKIKVHFPDDLTNWQTDILAYGRGRRTGQVTVNSKSYLPISGRLLTPSFMMPGDSVWILGKTSNYTSISQNISYAFFQNDSQLQSGSGEVNKIKVDSLKLSAINPNDTLEIVYSIQTENGFSDGERRNIPVLDNSISISKGHFWALDSDTTITVNFADSLGSVHFYASANLKNVFLDEIEYLVNYKYSCNEQLASRLVALGLANKLSRKVDGVTNQAKVNKIVKSLQERQHSEGHWGWWSENDFEPWVTEHIIKSYFLIDDITRHQLNFENLISKVIWDLNKPMSPSRKISMINIMSLLDSAFNLGPYLNDLHSE